jgi:hypothetical protein
LILLKTILDRLRTLWQYGKLEHSLDSFSNECRGWSRSDFIEESLDRVADWFRNPAYRKMGIPLSQVHI